MTLKQLQLPVLKPGEIRRCDALKSQKLRNQSCADVELNVPVACPVVKILQSQPIIPPKPHKHLQYQFLQKGISWLSDHCQMGHQHFLSTHIKLYLSRRIRKFVAKHVKLPQHLGNRNVMQREVLAHLMTNNPLNGSIICIRGSLWRSQNQSWIENLHIFDSQFSCTVHAQTQKHPLQGESGCNYFEIEGPFPPAKPNSPLQTERFYKSWAYIKTLILHSTPASSHKKQPHFYNQHNQYLWYKITFQINNE